MGDRRVHFAAFLRKRESADDRSQSERVNALPEEAVRIVGGWCALTRCRPWLALALGGIVFAPMLMRTPPAVPGRGGTSVAMLIRSR
jgi:hypothetical protein